MRSADRDSPAGIPARTATRPRPCASPAVVNRNVTLRDLPHNRHQPPPPSTNLPIIAREPDSGSGSRDLHAVPPLHVAERGSGGEASRSPRRLWVGVRMVGRAPTTRPRRALPNRYRWPLVASNATRRGPLTGSRTAFLRWRLNE